MSNQENAHWTVADGMGGHNAGDVASQEICKAAEKLTQTDDFPAFIDNIELSLQAVNQMLVELAEKENGLVGSTVVGMAFNKEHAVSYWAGDSRAYRMRKCKLEPITTDHTVVQEMLEANLIRPDEINSHPEKNIITRAVGSDYKLQLDFTIDKVEHEDIYIVCSDGVEKEVSDPELEALVNKTHALPGSPEFASDDLNNSVNAIVDLVLERGARDNVSVILVKFLSTKSDSEEE
jgi:serine/threonine-protein phosphatase Stp1